MEPGREAGTKAPAVGMVSADGRADGQSGRVAAWPCLGEWLPPGTLWKGLRWWKKASGLRSSTYSAGFAVFAAWAVFVMCAAAGWLVEKKETKKNTGVA